MELLARGPPEYSNHPAVRKVDMVETDLSGVGEANIQSKYDQKKKKCARYNIASSTVSREPWGSWNLKPIMNRKVIRTASLRPE